MKSKIVIEISKDLLIPASRLDYLIRSAPYRYKVYKIPKKSGNGHRIIAQPAKEIKQLQYWAIKNVLSRFPIHESAIAYQKGNSIYDNAKPHSNYPYMLKLDFRSFFPSIKGKDFLRFLDENKILDYSRTDCEYLMKILFRRPNKFEDAFELSIGAPSSPILSNIILHRFDTEAFDFCQKHEIQYTRYADDMTFSMNDKSLRKFAQENICNR